MERRIALLTIVAVLSIVGSGWAQQNPPPQAPAVRETPGQQAARRAGQPVNIKLDVTLNDQSGTNQRRTKTVTVVAADGLQSFVRTEAFYEGGVGTSRLGNVPLNIDVEPRILTGGKIRVLLNLQYNLPVLTGGTPADNAVAVLRNTQILENLSLILDDGKPLVVAQSADPVGDRRVAVEVVATIMK
jgi:hypothetical protein